MGSETGPESDEVRAHVRAVWGGEQLREFWERAREALESPRKPDRFGVSLPDDESRRAVSEIYGRPLYAEHSRIMVSKLDKVLRENTRFGLGLAQVLEILHERPVEPRESPSAARAERRDRTTDMALAALAGQGLAEQPWAQPWVQWLHQYGRVADEELEGVTRRAASVLSAMVLTPGSAPTSWASRGDLAARVGRAHELDNGTTLSRVVLRAAALAHGVEPPGNERERRALWERCGVTLDAVSATVLCWALPLADSDEWSGILLRRTELGLPTHLTHQDLAAAPGNLVEAGAVVAVCENPRVLEAAAQERIRHPVVCVSGQPTTVALSLLARLRSDGAELRYHGDFDWAGVSIARQLWSEHGVRLWRMSAADYRESVDRAHAERLDLPPLVGSPVDTPWDPGLAELMSTVGSAVEEEVVLPVLLSDLRVSAAR